MFHQPLDDRRQPGAVVEVPVGKWSGPAFAEWSRPGSSRGRSDESFVLDRGAVAGSGVPPVRMVSSLNVVKQLQLGFRVRAVGAATEPLTFQGREEALR